MPIVTLSDLKLALGITGTSQDALLTALAAQADAACSNYCFGPDRTFDLETRTEYYTGNRYPQLVLYRRPVTEVEAVYVDPNRVFGPNSLLTPNQSYMLDQQRERYSRTGMLTLLQWPAEFLNIWPLAWGPNPSWGGLTGYGAQQIGWPAAPGCIKVVYSAGYNPTPADLTAAGVQVGCWLYNNQKWGGMVASNTSYIDVSTGLTSAIDALGSGAIPALGTARQILQRYREWGIGYGP